MMMMSKPIILEKFTIEDIHVIREWNYEERKRLGKDIYCDKVKKTVDEILKDMPKSKRITV